MFELADLPIPGLKRVRPRVARDPRGSFVKILHDPTFREFGLSTDFVEMYYSTSRAGVIRGMHFQTPPHDHDKLVYCTVGKVLDVVLDLRRSSPTFRRAVTLELDAAQGEGAYIPRGCAHGFCAVSEEATLLYLVTTVYSPAHDTGVRWDSVGVDWPVPDPVISERDAGFASLGDFDTPFS